MNAFWSQNDWLSFFQKSTFFSFLRYALGRVDIQKKKYDLYARENDGNILDPWPMFHSGYISWATYLWTQVTCSLEHLTMCRGLTLYPNHSSNVPEKVLLSLSYINENSKVVQDVHLPSSSLHDPSTCKIFLVTVGVYNRTLLAPLLSLIFTSVTSLPVNTRGGHVVCLRLATGDIELCSKQTQPDMDRILSPTWYIPLGHIGIQLASISVEMEQPFTIGKVALTTTRVKQFCPKYVLIYHQVALAACRGRR